MNFDILPTITEVSSSLEQLDDEDGKMNNFHQKENFNNEVKNGMVMDMEQTINSSLNNAGSDVEHFMMSILDERDSLLDKVGIMRKEKSQLEKEYVILQQERDLFFSQLESGSSHDYSHLLKSSNQVNQTLLIKQEEIYELKAERENVKLLLSHLEVLVSKHERNMQSTLIKRQLSQQGGYTGVSSEVEVLKALKSLFEHHKMLDDKVRTKLQSSQENVAQLEMELAQLNEEVFKLREKNIESLESNQNTHLNHLQTTYNSDIQKIDSKSLEQIETLKLEKKTMDEKILQFEQVLENSSRRINEMKTCLTKLEEKNNSLQESVIATQESLRNSQTRNQKLDDIICEKDVIIRSLEMENSKVKSQFDASTKASIASAKNDELVKCLNELTEAESKNDASRDRYRQLELQLQEAVCELNRACKREKLNEDHNNRLSATVDKLLNESCERLQVHMSEKILSIDKQNEMKIQIDEMQRSLVGLTSENTSLKKKIQSINTNYNKTVLELDYMRKEHSHLCKKFANDNVLINGYDPQITSNYAYNNIHKKPVTGPIHSDSIYDRNPGYSQLQQRQGTEYCKSNTLTCDKAPNAAIILQQQLDAINNEIRLIQEEKDINEQRRSDLVTYARSNSQSPCNKQFNESQEETPIIIPPIPLNAVTMTEKYIESNNNQYTDQTYEQSVNNDPFNQKISLYTEKKHSNSNGNLSENESYNSQTYINSNDECKEQYLEKRRKKSSLKNISNFFKKKNRALKKTEDSSGSNSRKNSFDEKCRVHDKKENNVVHVQSNEDKKIKQRNNLLLKTIDAGTEFHLWNGPTVVAWMELWVGMPLWYVAACRANVRNGTIMMNLSDNDIKKELGVSNPMHRLKLRLAISEIIATISEVNESKGSRNISREESTFLEIASKSPAGLDPGKGTNKITWNVSHPKVYNFIRMNHEWIGNDWIPSLGLSMHRSVFMENLVDVRMMKHFTRDEYESHFGITNQLHLSSIMCGTECLENLNFNLLKLVQMRKKSESSNVGLSVWSNQRVMKWIESLPEIRQYAINLINTGVNGSLLIYDQSFTVKNFCDILKMPHSKNSKNLVERRFFESYYTQLLESNKNNTDSFFS